MRVTYMDEPHAFRYLAANVFGVQPSRVPVDLRQPVNRHPCICQAIGLLYGRAVAPKIVAPTIDSATHNAMQRRVSAYVRSGYAYSYGDGRNDASPEARMGRAMACLWLAEEAEDV